MVCRNCGKKLRRNDRFCSQCGTPVAEVAAENINVEDKSDVVPTDSSKDVVGEDRPFGFEAPKEKFDWNLDGNTFPGNTPTKTEDVDFDWNIKSTEFKSRPDDEPEIAFSPIAPSERWSALEAEEAKRKAEEEKRLAEEKSRQVAAMIKKREEERRLEAEIQQKARIAAEAREAAERREREKAAAEEERKALAEIIKKAHENKANVEKEMAEKIAQEAVEKERMLASEKAKAQALEKTADEQDLPVAENTEALPVTEENPAIEKPENERSALEGFMQDRSDDAELTAVKAEEPSVEDKTTVSDSEDVKPMTAKIQDVAEDIKEKDEVGVNAAKPVIHVIHEKSKTENIISGKELEEELFGGSAVRGLEDEGEGLSRHTAKIDRFYTINQKNEEFQKLLDREYEKVRGGEPLDDDVFAADVKKINTEIEERGKTQIFQPVNQTEEMARAREELFGSDDSDVDYKVNDKADSGEPVEESIPADTIVIPVPDRPFEDFLKDEPEVKSDSDTEVEDLEDSAPETSPDTEQEIEEKEKHTKDSGILENEGVTFESKSNEVNTEEFEEENKGRGCLSKIIIFILFLILFTLMGALAMKYFAPTHVLTQRIDEVTDKVLNMFMMLSTLVH